MTALDPRSTARIMGGDVTGPDSCNVPGPGHGPNDRSLSIKFNARAPGGYVVYSHAGDDPIECRDYVRQRLGLASWTGELERPLAVTQISASHQEDKQRRVSLALKIWADSIDPAGTIVHHYLRRHRGLKLGNVAANIIRFHDSLYYDDVTQLPGMVCLLRDIMTDEPCGIHRTFLNRETGAKIGRKMLGIARGAAVKLDAQATVTDHLVIGEGVETVMAGREAGFRPGWALGSSGAVRAFPVLKRLSDITILGENDDTSRRDATICERRYLDAQKPVNIVRPHIGKDFNDVWRACQ